MPKEKKMWRMYFELFDINDLFLDFACDFASKQRLNLKVLITQVHERKKCDERIVPNKNILDFCHQ